MYKFLLTVAAVSFIPLRAYGDSAFFPYMSGGVVPESINYSGEHGQGRISMHEMGKEVKIKPGTYTFTATFFGESNFTCEHTYQIRENDTPVISVNATGFSNGQANCTWSD